MKKKNSLLKLFILLVFAVVACIFTAPEISQGVMDLAYNAGYQSEKPKIPDIVQPALEKMISSYQRGEISVIDLSTATTFKWDRLYIFGGYAGPSKLNRKVGGSWHSIDNCTYAVGRTTLSQGYGLLVFLFESKIMHCSLYQISNSMPYFYLTESEFETGFSPQEALFIVRGDFLDSIPRK